MKEHESTERRGPYLLLLIFFLLAAGIVTVGYLYYRNYERHYRSDAEHQLSAIAELKVGELVQYRNERLGDASILNNNPAFSQLVRRFLEQPEDADAQRQLQTWLGKYQARYHYDRIFLLDAQGGVRMSAPESPMPVAAVILARLPEILRSGQPAFQDFYRHEQNQRIYLSVLVPLHDEADGNRPLGVIVMGIDPATYLYPFILRWPTPSKTAETLLVRREGNEVVFLNELRFQTNTALNLRTPLEKKEQPAVMAVLGMEGIVEGRDYRAEPVIADVRAVPDSPWFMVARRDVAEVFAPSRERLWMTVFLVVALLLGTGAGTGMLWRQQRVRFYREQAELAETLRQTRDYLENLITHANAPIIVWDPQFKITRFNRAFESLTGRRADEVIGKSLEILFPSARVESSMALIKKTLGGEHWETVEIAIVHLDGSVRTVLWNSATIVAPDGKTPVATIAQGHDITVRKRAEEALRESEERYHTLFETMDEGFCIIEMLYDPDGKAVDYRFVEINPAFERHTGLQQALGKTIRQMVPNHDEHWFEIYGNVARTGKAIRIKNPAKAMQRYYDAFAFRIGGDGSQRVGVLFSDITESKRAEKALRESQARYAALFEHNPIETIVVDLNGRIQAFNRAKRESGDRLPQIDEVMYRDYAGKHTIDMHSELMHCIRSGESRHYPERPYGKRILSIDIAPFADGAIITLQDVTERKRAEAALQFTRTSLDNAADVMICADRDARFIDVNNACCRSWGYSREELLSMSVHDIDPDYSAEIWTEFWEKLKQSGSLTFESCHHTKQGKVYPVEIIATFFEYNGKEYHCSFARDITERKRAEEALQQSELKYRRLHEAMTDAFVLMDMAGHILECNRSYRDMLGYNESELRQLTCQDITPEKWHAFERIVQEQILPQGYSDVYEKEYRHKDGTVFPVQLRVSLIRDDAGQPAAMYAIVRDITERKQAKAALRMSETRYRSLFDNMVEGFAYCRMLFEDGRPQDFIYIEVNEAYQTQTGLKNVTGRKVSEVIPGIRESDPELFERYGRVALTGKPERFETYIAAMKMWFSISVYSPEKEYIVVVFDVITERKRAEETLRELSLRLSQVQDKERRHIARELHDSTGQKLAALSMIVGLLHDATGAPDGKTEKMFADCLAMIEQCAQEIRTHSYQLHPPLLDELGLAAAIGNYVEGFSKRSGMQIALDAPLGLERWPDEVEIALFRVVQESLGNIHRHSGASTAHIRLAWDAEQVTLEVSDQGHGMSAKTVRAIEAGRGSTGVGIAGMQGRLRLLGGRLEIKSGEQGTTVRAIVPRREEPT